MIRSEVAKQLGMRHAPTLEFVADALPETARHLDEVLAKARALDEEVAARRGAAYAGERGPVQEAARGPSRRGRRPTRTTDVPTRMTESGLVVVDKPAGITSHDVVARVRRLAGTRKVGHAGTLDPMATGVLVVGVERATRLLGHLMLTDKAYDATVRLGVATTTDDAEGEVVATASAGRARRGDVRGVLAEFVGDLLQVPDSGLGDQGGRQARLPAGPRRRAGRARAATGHRARAGRPRRRGRRRASSTSTSRCAAPAAPTSAPSPATPAPGSASAAT